MGNEFRVAAVFSNHMVLQRDKRLRIWGEGADGEHIVVQCAGQQAEGSIANGQWSVSLAPVAAGGPYGFSVRCGGEQIEFTDVWFGDVWLAGGQSNMEWSLMHAAEGAEELPEATQPQIRLLQVPRNEYEDRAAAAEMEWKPCTPVHAAGFSAVAYFFAKKLQPEIAVPIGLINCNWGGTSASAWMDMQRLMADAELRVYPDEFAEQVSAFDESLYAEVRHRYDGAVEEYHRKEEAGASKEELGRYPWPPPFHPYSFMRPGGLYQTMVRRVSPYAIKGFLFYQGEGDAHRPVMYAKLLETMIRNWREDWQDETLPFLFVQLPAFGCDGDLDGEQWPLLRESQRLVTNRLPHTCMIVSLDCGEKEDIHPKRKRPIGERLAITALHEVYGLPVQHRGPRLLDKQTAGDRLILTYGDVGEGLQSSGNGQLAGFEVAGADGSFVKADARILDRSKVAVWSGQVKQPLYIRYAWTNWTEADLANSMGLPAGPFRDTVPN
ncbi:MAG: sialate O-acetylesterase [Paenibacillaceae bacterium]|jgi:sialate O-acetylesterase|nr:sialate O-acetylesterase [Paenibacillaceae bacterium]